MGSGGVNTGRVSVSMQRLHTTTGMWSWCEVEVTFFLLRSNYLSLLTETVSSGYSCVLPQSKDIQVRLIGDSKLPIGVIVSVTGCLSLCVSPVIEWRPVQGICDVVWHGVHLFSYRFIKIKDYLLLMDVPPNQINDVYFLTLEKCPTTVSQVRK